MTSAVDGSLFYKFGWTIPIVEVIPPEKLEDLERGNYPQEIRTGLSSDGQLLLLPSSLVYGMLLVARN